MLLVLFVLSCETVAVNRMLFRLFVVLVPLSILALWVAVREDPRTLTLQEGLKCVEVDNGPRIKQIEEALKRSGQPDQATILECTWLARHGRFAEALKQLPTRLLDGPLRREALRLLGECQFRLGDHVTAEVSLKQATTEFPNDVESYRNLALLYYGVGMNELAMQAQSHIRRLTPLDYRPYLMAGLVWKDAEEYRKASVEFQQALDCHPPSQVLESIRFDLTYCLVQSENYQEAVTVLMRDRASNAGSALLAECHWHLGDKAQAKEVVKDVLSLEPLNIGALRVKAWFLEELGRKDETVELLQRVIKSTREDFESRDRLIRLLEELGQNAEREQVETETSTIRELRKRLTELTTIASNDLNAVEPRHELAGLCRELGRVEQAVTWQRSAEFCSKRNARSKARP